MLRRFVVKRVFLILPVIVMPERDPSRNHTSMVNNKIGGRLASLTSRRTAQALDPSLPLNPARQSRGMALLMSNRERTDKKKFDVEGTGRGVILQAIVLTICIWLFSIPPEFRRAHFCVATRCVEDRSRCYDCVTLSEWTTSVGDYYRNGNG